MDYLGLFAKYWEPGKVKTRLAANLGDDVASKIYGEFLRVLAHRFRSSADRRILCVTPPESQPAFAELGQGAWAVESQSEGDLGQRMASFFESSFRLGAERVVLIGSDSPTMPTEFVDSAFQRLQEQDVVLGPTCDGGYYLVGLSANVPAIFEGIDWSTAQVWEQTVERVERLRLSFDSLPPWYDIDEVTDLTRLRDELFQSLDGETAFAALLAAIQEVV